MIDASSFGLRCLAIPSIVLDIDVAGIAIICNAEIANFIADFQPSLAASGDGEEFA
jgi:hypothetical protein